MSAGAFTALVVVATTLLCSLAIVSILVRKLLRDRRELRSSARRDHIRRAILEQRSAELGASASEAVEDVAVQWDMAVALEELAGELEPSRLHAAQATVQATNLPDHLCARLGSRDPVERGISALLLSLLRLPQATEALPPLLFDLDTDVRLVACSGLGRLQCREGAEALIAALVVGALPAERLIEQLGWGWAVPSLIDVLEAGRIDPAGASAEAADRKAAVARALGLAADPRAEPALLRLLREGGLEERINAARALGCSGTPACLDELIRALDDDAWEVRAQAAKTLGMHGDRDAELALAVCLHDDAWWVRANSAAALAQLGEGGLELLRNAAASNPDRYARQRAAEELALAGATSTNEAAAEPALVAA